jgi:hypothetical protein
MHWSLQVSAAFSALPAQGDLTPGQTASVKITRSSPGPRSILQILVDNPATPNANIPEQEYFGFVSPN